MKEGILIISVGDRHYAEMASNLAISIKASDPTVKIAVITDGNINALVDEHKSLFDMVIPTEHKNPFYLKTQLYKLTPFSKTLYLDVDSIFIFTVHSISSIIKEMDKYDIVIQELDKVKKGEYSSSLKWAATESIWGSKKLKDDDVYPVYNTSFIYFKKSKKIGSYFNAVEQDYKKPVTPYNAIGGFYPDELAFGTASAKKSVYSDINGYEPMYFPWSPKMNRSDIVNFHDFVTLSGKVFSQNLVNLYDDCANAAGRRIGVRAFKFNKTKKIF